ncbi:MULTISPECIES: transcriptional regulator [Actinomyces]|uniref:transcriptional regulator n=1 Tax=Actinomyces TaxID=1654 RepID=UPI00109DC1BA|nr:MULTISPECIES: transcriptional regulator [Actinomyces]MDO4899885.1 transcriptional regulator [Actinomyces sp.]
MNRSTKQLDPIIHTQSRLRIMATLAAIPQGDRLVFPRLRQLLDMTAGNLSTHLTRLEEAGYVEQSKTFYGRSPATYVSLTARGRVAFADYTRQLRALLGDK